MTLLCHYVILYPLYIKMIKTLTMEIQEIKIDGITYIRNKCSRVCSDCAVRDKVNCAILIQGEQVTLCHLFDGYALKVKEEYEK